HETKTKRYSVERPGPRARRALALISLLLGRVIDELGSRRAKDVMAAIYGEGINPWTQGWEAQLLEATLKTKKEGTEKGRRKAAEKPVNYRAMARKLASQGLLREGVCFQWGVRGGRYVITRAHVEHFEC